MKDLLDDEDRKHAHLIELTTIEQAVVMAVAHEHDQPPAEVIQKMISTFLKICEKEVNDL